MVSDQKYPKEKNIREHALAFIEGKSKQMIIQIISRQCFVYGRKLDHAWEFLQLSLVTCVATCRALIGREGVAFDFFLAFVLIFGRILTDASFRAFGDVA